MIFVISGPSGSGKTTLLEELLKDPDLQNRGLVKSRSFTTRPRRSCEQQEKDYFFISEENFKQKRKSEKIIEWTKYLGYYYATPREFIERQLKSSRHIILCLDLKGAKTLKRLYPRNTVTIFIKPPSLGALRERIAGRCHKTVSQEIRQRLKVAKRELRAARGYDYSLLNKNLPQAAKGLKGLILREMSSRRERE